MLNKKQFEEYAKYYDLLYIDKDYNKEVNFLIDKFNQFGNNIRSIIDLGCGTGKHSEKLKDKGYIVHGVDLSEEMITIAKEKSSANLSFSQGDLRTYRGAKSKLYDAAVSLFHVMCYQVGNEDVEKAFQTAYAQIVKGGLFIFDLWYGPAVLTDEPVVRIKRLEDKNIKILRIAEPTMHDNRNMVDVRFEILITNKENSKLTILHEVHSMRYFFYPEIELFAAKAGFKILDFGEWLTSSLPSRTTWNAYFVCQKYK